MARGRKQRTSKTPSTVLEAQLGHGVASGPHTAHTVIYIDDVLSRNNQRLYRQHKTYYADLRLSNQRVTTSPIEVWVLKSNWAVLNSLRMAKKMHDKALRAERALLPKGQAARWYDFRIQPEWTAGSVTSLTPLGLDKDTLNLALVDRTGGERLYSSIRDRDGNDVEFVLKGSSSPSAGRLNVFEEFSSAGNIQDEPSSAIVDAPYEELFPIGELEAANYGTLQNYGNLPPYNPDDHNQVWTKAGELFSDASGVGQLNTGVFAAPLGIVFLRNYQLQVDGAAVNDEGLTLEVMPGTYKGVAALDI
jgi:hypothetical protein